MRRRVLAALALTATAAMGAVAAEPATAVPASSGSHLSSVATRSRPTAPRAFHRALVAAGRARAGAGAPAAAGFRSIGNGVSTDLPSRVSLGSDLVRVPFTIVVPTGSVNDPAIEIGLLIGNTADTAQLVLDSFIEGTAGQTTFRGALTVPSGAVRLFGSASWVIAYGSASSDTARTAATGTTVKITSILGESLTRRGDAIRVVGAAKVFDGLGYVARPGIRVGIDRYAGNGRYVRLATVTTDSRGHLDVTVRVSFRVGIRLTTADTADVFGAVTPTTAV